jgi:hypothetical protein
MQAGLGEGKDEVCHERREDDEKKRHKAISD